jgi:hypothetical protein
MWAWCNRLLGMVTIYTEPLASRPLTADQTLTGGDILPGFSTPISAIFE